MSCSGQIVRKTWVYLFLSAMFVAAVSFAADAPSGDPSKTDASKADTAKTDASKGDTAVDLKVIKPEEAKDYEGKEVIVEFQVANARELGTGICFLNSSNDFNDPNAFTAVISAKGLSEFKKDSNMEKPADFFKDKKVRISGKVVQYQKDKDSPKKFEIKVDAPNQIKVIETDAHKT